MQRGIREDESQPEVIIKSTMSLDKYYKVTVKNDSSVEFADSDITVKTYYKNPRKESSNEEK